MGLEPNVVISQDDPTGAVLDTAEWANGDLIVIASHVPRVSDIFLGSTAAWVVRHADCSVHVIR